jgi:hypothetical protein
MRGSFGIFIVSLGLAILGHTHYTALLHDTRSWRIVQRTLLISDVTSAVNKTVEYYLLECDVV